MPVRLKFALGLLVLPALGGLLLIVMANLTLAWRPDSEFWMGVQDAVAHHAGTSSRDTFTARMAGQMTAESVFTLIPVGLAMAGIFQRKFGLALGGTIGAIIVAIAQRGIPIVQIIALILLIGGSAKRWLQREPVGPPREGVVPS
jgi:hypothetical protein